MRLEAFQWLETEFHDTIVARANDLTTMAALIREGIGMGLLPADQLETGLQPLWQVPHLRGELWLLTHPDLRHATRIRVVWDAILAALS